MNVLQRLKLNLYDDRETERLIREGEYAFTKQPLSILDLGAHKGFATAHFARLYPSIPIHAYEANPALFRVLARRTRAFPNVTCHNEAIIERDGPVRFPIAERAVSSSIFGTGDMVSIQGTSLQTALKRLAPHLPASVKSDIEGAEFVAFKDLSGVQEIVGEVHPEKAGRTNEDFRALLARFHHIRLGEGKSVFSAV